MIRALLPSLLLLASVAAMARAPRFLGPPVKKPADAGPAETPDAGEPCDAGEPPDGGAEHGEADPPARSLPSAFIVDKDALP